MAWVYVDFLEYSFLIGKILKLNLVLGICAMAVFGYYRYCSFGPMVNAGVINVGVDKRQKGKTSKRTNVREEKLRSGQK